ncbi:hypothetical protein EJB05_51078 [Eragrostis curvula]|uniref:NTF2 domain-containing protein n=1 Tax=Eragrostis curvula TaxID=38414 RepID=A0A5J9SWT4_9POAL|nr:hypothetical protein EJB05_51067 [Eragrostis curvula]TVU03387.1 hypothetical protein EJB05_51078 [Eragrostis curvula]
MDKPPHVSAAAIAAARSEVAADLRLHAHQVGNAFVQDYYAKLRHSPEQVRGFYHEGSRLTRPNAGGGVDTVTTLEDINRKIMAMDAATRTTVRERVSCFGGANGVILIMVIGSHDAPNNSRTRFNQTFVIGPREGGRYSVLDDTLSYDFRDNAPTLRRL